MRFISLDALPRGSPEIVCRVSGRRTLLVALGAFVIGGAALSLAISRVTGSQLMTGVCYAVCFAAFSLALLAYLSYWRTLDPSVWICQIEGDRLLLRCSRFCLDTDVAGIRVLELVRGEIAWFGPLRLHLIEDGPDQSGRFHKRGGVEHKWIGYLDVGLTESAAAALDVLLSDAGILPQIRELFSPGVLVADQPVRRMEDGTLRVYWGDAISNVTPRLESIERIFSRLAQVRALRRETVHGLSL